MSGDPRKKAVSTGCGKASWSSMTYSCLFVVTKEELEVLTRAGATLAMEKLEKLSNDKLVFCYEVFSQMIDQQDGPTN